MMRLYHRADEQALYMRCHRDENALHFFSPLEILKTFIGSRCAALFFIIHGSPESGRIFLILKKLALSRWGVLPSCDEKGWYSSLKNGDEPGMSSAPRFCIGAMALQL
jgi:hypothetical protein